MERILNSIEELYQLITSTLPEGYVEHIPNVNWSMLGDNSCYGNQNIANYYFVITDTASHNNVKIEYGGKFSNLVTARIYKYV